MGWGEEGRAADLNSVNTFLSFFPSTDFKSRMVKCADDEMDLTSADFRAYPFSEGCLAGERERKRALPVLCVVRQRPSAKSQQVDRSSLIDRTSNKKEEEATVEEET